MQLAAAAVVFALAATSAMAQQIPTEDLRASYEMAIAQRNRAADAQIEIALGVKKQVAAEYEARLATAMEWLKAAQATKPTK